VVAEPTRPERSALERMAFGHPDQTGAAGRRGFDMRSGLLGEATNALIEKSFRRIAKINGAAR